MSRVVTSWPPPSFPPHTPTAQCRRQKDSHASKRQTCLHSATRCALLAPSEEWLSPRLSSSASLIARLSFPPQAIPAAEQLAKVNIDSAWVLPRSGALTRGVVVSPAGRQAAGGTRQAPRTREAGPERAFIYSEPAQLPQLTHLLSRARRPLTSPQPLASSSPSTRSCSKRATTPSSTLTCSSCRRSMASCARPCRRWWTARWSTSTSSRATTSCA